MIFILPTGVTCVAKSRVATTNYQTRGDRKNQKRNIVMLKKTGIVLAF